ncbi:MAG: aminoacetone oxidase family FAD-binding enzyme [Candidatus Pacebacteria bacterium]|jgi:predicted Rossmann fold flavoprotein|nr:aminoacetone oxidase family FAD-binding enzyme [Candidatus Paceibacterota bacterium]
MTNDPVLKQNHFDVIVIGGGASGMMAAGRAAECGKKVLLLEKNKYLGEKLKISGGGRCNILNAEYDMRTLLSHYGKADQFLFSAFTQFGMPETWEFFESRGLPLFVSNDRKRAFPKSEKALDVFKTLEKYLKKGSVVVKTGSPVARILADEGKISGVETKDCLYTANSYILATGGMSHPETGSTGDGFGWLRDLGHTVETPTPSIVPLAVSESWIKSLAGVSLTNMRITFFIDGVKSLKKTGGLLFTHFGLSGPLILNSAKAVGDMLYAGLVTAQIDLYPDLDIGALEKKIIDIFDTNKNKLFKTVMSEIAPAGMSDVLLQLTESVLPPETRVHSITKEQRKGLLGALKGLEVTITGLLGFDKAVVADGGIILSEIDTKTMRSKKLENLFITGDLLHVTRPSGGYSLQLCWTTGYITGSNA